MSSKLKIAVPTGETVKVKKTYGKGQYAKTTVVVVPLSESDKWIARGYVIDSGKK